MQKAYARHTHRSVFLRQLQWALQHATQSRLSGTRHSFASCQKCWLLSYFLGISFGQRELSPSKLHTFFSGQPAPNDLLMKRYRGLNHLPQFKTPQFKGYSISEPSTGLAEAFISNVQKFNFPCFPHFFTDAIPESTSPCPIYLPQFSVCFLSNMTQDMNLSVGDEETEDQNECKKYASNPQLFYSSVLSGQEEADPNSKTSYFLMKNYFACGSRQTYVQS